MNEILLVRHFHFQFAWLHSANWVIGLNLSRLKSSCTRDAKRALAVGSWQALIFPATISAVHNLVEQSAFRLKYLHFLLLKSDFFIL